jgi:hypothetical protein
LLHAIHQICEDLDWRQPVKTLENTHNHEVDEELRKLCFALAELVNEVKNDQPNVWVQPIPREARRTALKLALPAAHPCKQPVRSSN